MAMDFDAQLIESVEVCRNRLTSSLACALRVAISLVIMVLTHWQEDRAEHVAGKPVRTVQTLHDGAAQ